ncbi:autotransporter-associated N-terminal domain-containing protein [Fusobacterium sp. PH5-44]|uniref:autotransporter-associated N-terminal domain-containing protein n=1 Tax=unclassified Fusobacterium TaxID=2648384 RepID=UPI003D23E8C7
MNSSFAKENGNALKRFIKRKISYTSGLLIAFLITGAIGFAAGVTNEKPIDGTVTASESFSDALTGQIAYIKNLLTENEKSLSQSKKDEYELLRKGDFYSKPIYPSTQIFFNYGYERSGKSKNRTSEEWGGTLEDIKYRMAGYTLPKGKNPYHEGELIAKGNGFDFGPYNPESSIYGPEYLTPLYKTDESGNLVTLPVDLDASKEYYTDMNGNKYYSATDSDGNKQIVDSNGRVVILDELGDVVMESSLADKNIGGNIPKDGVEGLDPVLDGKNAMDELVEGNGVYIQEEVKKMDEILVDANLSEINAVIPEIDKNVAKNVSVNVQMPNSLITNFSANTLSINGTIHIPGDLPNISLTPPPSINSISISKPTFDLNTNKIGDGIDSLGSGNNSSNTYNVVNNDIRIGGLGTIAAVAPKFDSIFDGNIGKGKDPEIKAGGFVEKGIKADSATNANTGATYYNDANGADNGVIAQVEVKTGEFNLNRTSKDSWNYRWDNYTGQMTVTSPTDAVKEDVIGETANDKQGFVVVTTGIGRTGESSTFNVNRNLATDSSLNSLDEAGKVREFAHINMIDGRGWVDLQAKFGPHAEAAKNYTDNIMIGNIQPKYIVYENNGVINLNGMNQSFTNQYIQMDKSVGLGVQSKLLAINAGIINITPYKDNFNKIYGNNAVFVISAKATNKGTTLVQNVMYNSGTIKLSSPDSAVYVIDNTGGSVVQIEVAQRAYAINKGNINVSGGNNVGVLLNNIAKQGIGLNRGGLTLAVEKSINFADDNNIGFYVGANKYAIDDTNILSSDIEGIFKGNFEKGKENVGIYSKNGINLTEHVLTFVENMNSVGVATLDGMQNTDQDTITLGEGETGIKGGSNNIGLYAAYGNIKTTGDVILTSSNDGNGINNTAAFANKGKNITILGAVKADNTTDSAVLISKGKDSSENSSVLNIGNGTKGQLDIKILGSSSDDKIKAVGLYAVDGGKINIDPETNKSKIEVIDGVGMYSGTDSTIDAKKTVIKVSGTSGSEVGTAALYANNGRIDIANSTIEAINSVGAYATGNKAEINMENMRIALDKTGTDIGNAALYATDEAIINAKNSDIDFNTNGGYAIYTKEDGNVDIRGTTLTLRGKSVGMNNGGRDVIVDTNTKIVMMSNEAVVVTDSEINTASGDPILTVGGSSNKLSEYFDVGSVTAGTEIIDGNSVTYDQYAIAAVDGAKISIDENISKTATNDQAEFYFKRFVGQKVKLDVNADVAAQMTTLDSNAFDRFEGQVIALEGAASTTASSVNDTHIKIADGKTITADRADTIKVAGKTGAMGVYINYGILENNGNINVENDITNHVYDKAVGVYSVNGSKTTNESGGKITVGGNNSVGMLGYGWRVDEYGNPVTHAKEGFGTGEIDLTNNGTITMSGAGSVGIYANNNSGEDANVINNGKVVVGTKDSVDNSSVGIYGINVSMELGSNSNITAGKDGVGVYGEESTIEVLSGSKITVGENGAGIYGKDSTIKMNSGSTITTGKNGIGIYADDESVIEGSDLGTFILGEGATAIHLKDGSEIDDPSASIALEHGDGSKNLLGMVFEGNGDLLKNSDGSIIAKKYETAFDIDGTKVVNGILLAGTKGAILSSSGSLELGASDAIQGTTDNVVGIYTNSGAVGVNKGTITLNADHAIGMYTKEGAIANINGGVINVNNEVDNNGIDKTTQIGMAVEGSFSHNYPNAGEKSKITNGGYVFNDGKINLNSNGTVGIYINNGATGLLTGSGIDFKGTNSFGVIVNGANGTRATLNLGNDNIATLLGYTPEWNDIVHKGDGENNILVLATGYSDIYNRTGDNGKKFIVGDSTKELSDGTIGIYLEGDNNTYTDVTGSKSYVYNNGVGVYSRGNNELALTMDVHNTTASKPKAGIGVYLDGNTNKITGTISATGDTPDKYAIGVYVNEKNGTPLGINTGGVAQISGKLIFTLKDYGTGMYLENNSYATGGTIEIWNAASAGNNNIGLYYSKGKNGMDTVVTHDTTLDLKGDQVVGLYAADTIQLINGKGINYEGTDNIGAFISGKSVYTSNSTGDNIKTNNSIGMYVEEGKAINNGTITISNNKSFGMIAAAKDEKVATVVNDNTIVVNNGVGMGIKGDIVPNTLNTGINNNNIIVHTDILATDNISVGVLVEGTGAKFDGTNSTINVIGAKGIGMALKETEGNQITKGGVINLGTDSSLGIHASGSDVDFDVELIGAGTGIFVEKGNRKSTVSGIVDGSNMTSGSIGLYVNGTNTTFGSEEVVLNNTVVKTGTQNTGIYFAKDYKLGNTAVISNRGSTGIHVGKNTTLELDDNTMIDVDRDSIGVYVDGTGSSATTLKASGVSLSGATLKITDGSIGIVNNGVNAVSYIGVDGNLTVDYDSEYGVLVYNKGGYVEIGDKLTIITSGAGKGIVGFSENGDMKSDHGNIVINNGEVGLFTKLNNTALKNTYSLENTGVIKVNANGIGMYVNNDGTFSGDMTFENNGTVIVNGENAVGLYSNYGAVINKNTMSVTGNGIGLSLEGDADSADVGDLDVVNGTGVSINGNNKSARVSPTLTGNINLGAGTANNYNIGSFFLDFNGDIQTLPTINTSNNTIKTAIDGGNNKIHLGIVINGANKNEVGLYAKSSNTILTQNVNVAGEENIGVYSDNGTITGNIVSVNTGTAYDSVNPFKKASIGMYLSNNSTGNVKNVVANRNSIGLLATDASIGNVGHVISGANAIGAYANNNSVLNINGTVDVSGGGYGLFGDNSDINTTGNVIVGAGKGMGIVSKGEGNIDYKGELRVGAASVHDDASVGIYKENSSGMVKTNSTSDWSIGKYGYGIYLDNKNYTGMEDMILNNYANMNLSESSIGIFATGNGSGTVLSDNHGTINVGTSEERTSAGFYVGNGATGTNKGIINVESSSSLGAYVTGVQSKFTNDGTINVNNSAVGILAKDGSTVINNGNIILGTDIVSADKKNIGIAAYGSNSVITTVKNNGYIEVGNGVGIYGNEYALIVNGTNGTIRITADGGTGLLGYEGMFINQGRISIDPHVEGTLYAKTNGDSGNVGAISIVDDGIVVINNQFIHAGTIEADKITVDGAYVSIANANNNPMFVVNSITGEINLESDFITTGNGYGWTVPDFVAGATSGGASIGDLLINTSPLFVGNVLQNGTLVVAKQPYSYLVTGTQFDNLYNGIDSLLAIDQGGTGKDSQILKNLNAYLDNIYKTDSGKAFTSEAERSLAEMRGDIYSTIQKRMQHVQGAFDSSFDEMLNSYNFTRDTGKFSVMYQQGDFKDRTIGIDDYDYRVQGLMYMKEEEGRKYGNKKGYSVGFAVSRFDFDDSPTYGSDSKEDVYSVRAGVHNVHSFGTEDTTRLVSRLELGYNRHEATRTLELDKVYKNEGKYNSYQVTLDNRLEKDFYRDLHTTIRGYVGLNVEYGYVDGFTEKAKGDSGLLLKVKSNDYFSVEGEVGVNATHRILVGKKLSVKLTGDLAYGHEFGTNYDRNKAKVAEGTEGYYSLIKPEEEKDHVKGRVGITIEKANHYGLTFDVEARKHSNKDSSDVRYGVRFNYKFMD